MLKKNSSIFILSFIFTYYFLSTIYLPIKFLWFDDWFIIKDYIFATEKITDFFFKFENGHLIIFYRLLVYLNIEFFNFNLNLFKYLNFIFLVINFFLLNILLNKYKIRYQYRIFFYLIYLNPEIITSWYQAVNTVWFMSSFFILLFLIIQFKNKYFLLIFLFFSIFANNFTLVLAVYSFIKEFLNTKLIKEKYKNFFFITFLIIVILFVLYKGDLFIINFFKSFFAILSNIFVPWIGKLYILAFAITIIQIFVILIFEFKKKLNIFTKTKLFFNENPILILSLIFAFLYSISRNDPYNAMSSRYVFGSIFFQIGFLIFLIKNNFKFLNFFKILVVVSFLQGFFSPYSGLHWQIIKVSQNQELLDCFNNSNSNHLIRDICLDKLRNITLSNNKNFSVDDFKKLDSIFINKKLIVY